MLSLCFGKVVQDFGHSTFFLSTHVPASNIKRGARGCFCISDSSGAGFCPSTVCQLAGFRRMEIVEASDDEEDLT